MNSHNCIWEKPVSTHIYKYVEIQFWNIKYNISWECKELLVCLSPLIHSYTMSFSWQTLKRELPTILDSFHTSITNDHIGVEVGGGGEPWSGGFFHLYKLNTSRCSHLRSVWALYITNSSQFDGQALWPIVWQFPAIWIPVHSHHCHLKATKALEHVRQAQETNPRKYRPGIGNDIHMDF